MAAVVDIVTLASMHVVETSLIRVSLCCISHKLNLIHILKQLNIHNKTVIKVSVVYVDICILRH